MAKANSVGSRPSNKHHLRKRGAVVGGDRLTRRRVGNDLALYRGASDRPLLYVVPDAVWPRMFRVRWRDGLGDFCNLSRAKDAGLAIALRDLNYEAQEKPSDGPYIRAIRRVGPSSKPARIPSASKKLMLGGRR